MSGSRCNDESQRTDAEEEQKCVLCDGEVMGDCDGVRLTICCMDCCVRREPDRRRRRVAQQTAMKEYHCTRRDLNELDSDHKVLPAMVFQLAEVEYMGKIRQARIEQKAEQQRANRFVKMRLGNGWVTDGSEWLSDKVFCLLMVLRVSQKRWKKRNRLLWYFMLGDYLEKEKGTRTQLSVVIKRFGVLNRVEKIVQSCRDAHPQAAFDFCLAHPRAGPVQFQEWKNKVYSVFRIAGQRIMSYLSREELKKLQGTPLEREALECMTPKQRKRMRRTQQKKDTRILSCPRPSAVSRKMTSKKNDQYRLKRSQRKRQTSKKSMVESLRMSVHVEGVEKKAESKGLVLCERMTGMRRFGIRDDIHLDDCLSETIFDADNTACRALDLTSKRMRAKDKCKEKHW